MRLRFCVALLCLPMRPMLAQQGPQDVVRAFFKAEDEGRWLDAARMLDLARFERVRRNALSAARHRGDLRGPTVESLMRMDPDMPRAVAEYQVKEWARGMRNWDYLAYEFARVTSADSLASLSLEEAAARWLEARSPEWRMKLSSKDIRGRPTVECPSLTDSAKKALLVEHAKEPRAVILGATTASGPDSYVVIDAERSGIVPDTSAISISPRVIALRRVNGAWKLEPAVDLPQSNGMGGGFVVSIECGLGTIETKAIAR